MLLLALVQIGARLLQLERPLLEEMRRGHHLVGFGQAGLGRHAPQECGQRTQLLVDLRALRLAARWAAEESLEAGLGGSGRRALSVERGQPLRQRRGPRHQGRNFVVLGLPLGVASRQQPAAGREAVVGHAVEELGHGGRVVLIDVQARGPA